MTNTTHYDLFSSVSRIAAQIFLLHRWLPACMLCLLVFSNSSVVGAPAALPQIVPNGLSAEQYYEMGRDYKTAGHVEQARTCLTRAIKEDPKGVGRKAVVYLHAYIPRYHTSEEATTENIIGFNQAAAGKTDAAIATYTACIKKYPQFEWPYSNLGSIYVERRNFKEARALLEKALEINPSYLNGWLHMYDLYKAENKPAEALACKKMARSIDPDSEALKFVDSEEKFEDFQKQNQQFTDWLTRANAALDALNAELGPGPVSGGGQAK